jgi:signal transduction histidine kinase
MLDRIEHLVEELRLTTDGLAHDLRSPLVRLRARGEQALAKAETPASQAAIEAMLKEADALLRMLATMLEISRAEAGLGRDTIAAVDLAGLARDVVEMYEPLAEERGLPITYRGEGTLIWAANRELLAQALANLVDNALNYGAGRIEVAATMQGECACLSVSDEGVGIPGERREEAVRRFGRLDPARSREGAGLGLALVNAIARMHGGRLSLSDNRPGLLVTIELPRRA